MENEEFFKEQIKKLNLPSPFSHKGENGRLLIIGGSGLFHAASLWAAEIASRIVDLVFYSSIKENNEIFLSLKKKFLNGIVVKREELPSYIEEADCILLGPGMVRPKTPPPASLRIEDFKKIADLPDEGWQTYFYTKLLLARYPQKKFVLDAGALQVLSPEQLLGLRITPILTPHKGELLRLFKDKVGARSLLQKDVLLELSRRYRCVILLKSQTDIICSPKECFLVKGGNAGMTKGGTGDVLAGLVAALYCKNEAFLSAVAASFLNKKAGEELFEKMGFWFNATDLVAQIPRTAKRYLDS